MAGQSLRAVSTGIYVQGATLTRSETRFLVNILNMMSRRIIARTPLVAFCAVLLCTSCTSPTLPVTGVVEPSSAIACSKAAASSAWQAPGVAGGGAELDFDTLIGVLAQSRVVFVGESHNRYDHHLNQLEIICRLHRRNPNTVIAMEFFQQPFQAYLDDFVADRIDAQEMLRDTEYYNRWGSDYRLYEPIMTFARAQGIAIVALNLPAEITKKVGRGGIDKLSEEERASLPDTMERSDSKYRERLITAFAGHPEGTRADFERFFEVQLLWDEGMAERAARFLVENPESRLVVLAGNGHVIRSGIPARLTRREAAAGVSVVLQGSSGHSPSIHEDDGDFMLVSKKLELPAAGLLGVMIGAEAGRVSILSFADGSAAEEAGLETGDRIVDLQGRPVSDLAGIKMGLLDKRPGDIVSVKVERKNGDGSVALLPFEVTLR